MNLLPVISAKRRHPSDPDGFGLPQVYLTVVDPGSINADTKTQATIYIVNAYGSTLSAAQRLVGNQYVDLKWAGNSTLLADKKAYNMTTLTAPSGSNNDQPLLGMPAGRDWRLLANAFDPTDLKNWFCLGIGNQLDLPWTAHGRHCEVFLNDVYQGTYFLAERVKRHANRIAIGNAASGAFICEIAADVEADTDEDLFTTPLMAAAGDPNGYSNHFSCSFAMEYGTTATADAAVNAFELDLVARDWSAVWTQMDMASAVDYFLWQDAIFNLDGSRFGSTRICRDNASGIKSGKLFFVGWDFDTTGGYPFPTPSIDPYNTPGKNRLATNRWFSIILEDPAFVSAVLARLAAFGVIFESRLDELVDKTAFLDSTGARDRNFAITSPIVTDGYIYDSPQEGTTGALALWNARWEIVQNDSFTPGESDYADEVIADSPLFYHRMASTGSTDPDEVGGTALTLSATGITKGIAGGVSGNDAMQFDGVSGNASRPVVLSPYTAITLEFWLKTSSPAAVELVLEVSTNLNTNDGSIAVVIVASELQFLINGSGGGYNGVEITLLADGAWHLYAAVVDRAASGSLAIIPYVDGAPVSYTKTAGSSALPAFYNDTLYVMSRAGTTFFSNGALDEFAIYPTALSSGRIAAHYAAR